MKINLVGTSFRNNQFELPIGTELELIPDPCGRYTDQKHDDKDAISVWYSMAKNRDLDILNREFLGYIPKNLNQNTFKSAKVVSVGYKEFPDMRAQPISWNKYIEGAYIGSIQIECELNEKETYYDIEQGTDEWFKKRAGKITSSKMSVITAWGKNKFGFPAIKYAQKLAIEKVYGWQKDEEKEGNKFKENADRGHALEPEAIKVYEKQRGVKVRNGGVFVNGMLADSPDGLPPDGLIEIKSVIKSVHEKNIKRNKVDPAYAKQVQFHIWVTQRAWCDFVSYCPEHETPLHIIRVYRDDKIIEEMRECIIEFNKLVNMFVNTLTLKKK